MRNLSPGELQTLLADHKVTLLDVRQAEELEIASLSPAIHIPLSELPNRFGELTPSEPIAVLCHHGVRSEMAGRLLERNGFTDVAHLKGGIDAWSLDVDESVPRY